MTGPAHDGCPDIKITPTPSGGLVLVGRGVTQIEHPAAVLASLGTPKPADALLTFLDEETPFAPIAQQFFAGQPFREQIVLVPWSLRAGPQAEALAADPAPAEQFADRYGLQIQVPPDRIRALAGTPGADRLVPVDDAGAETGWDSATAVRVLPRSHVAAREAMRLAVAVSAGTEPAPWNRLIRFLIGLVGLIGEPVPGPAWAAAVSVVLQGPPAGRDPAELTRSAMPMTMAGLRELVGGEPAPPAEVLAGLRANRLGAALVWYRPFHSAPRQVAWIAGDGERLWWIEPSDDGLPAPLDLDTDDRRRADLTDPDTVLVPVTPVGSEVLVRMVRPGEETGAPDQLRAMVPTTARELQRAIVTVRARFRRWTPSRADEQAAGDFEDALQRLRPAADAPVPAERLQGAREEFLDLLLAYDFLRARVGDDGLAPTAELLAEPDAYTLLIDAGFPVDDAHRIAGDWNLAIDPARLRELATELGLDAEGTRRLVELSEALGGIPGDTPLNLAEEARLTGLAGPGPLYALARDLALTPEELRPLGDTLLEVAGGSTAVDPAGGRPWVQRVREGLAYAGVRTDADLVGLARLNVRPEQFPLLGRMSAQQLSVELLGELPAELLDEALATYAGRDSDLIAGDLGQEAWWTARLGFDVRKLLPLLPNPYLERLLYQALGDVPALGVGDELRSVLEAGEAGRGREHTPAERDGLATRLGVPADRLDRVLTLPWVDLDLLVDLARRARLTGEETADLVDLVAETGRVPADLARWAYRLRTSPGRLVGLARRLRADPRRMAPLRPVFHRIAQASPAQRPTVDELAEMVREFAGAGRLDGPPTVESALWMASLGDGPDGYGQGALDRLSEPQLLGTSRQRLDEVLSDIEEARTSLTRIATAGGTAEPVLAGLLADAARVAELALAGLRTFHPDEEPGAATPAPADAPDVRRAVPAMHAARGGRDEPAARAALVSAVEALGDEARRLAAALRNTTFAATPAGRVGRAFAVTAVRGLAAVTARIPGGLRAWKQLAEGPAALPWHLTLRTALSESPRIGPAADRLLAPWWAARTGARPDHLRRALGPAGRLDPGELLRLVERPDLGAGARELLLGLAVEAGIPPHSLRPLIPLLLQYRDVTAEQMHRWFDASFQWPPNILGPWADPGSRLAFVADSGLTLTDLPDRNALGVRANRWLSDLLGVDAFAVRNLGQQPWFSLDAVADMFERLRQAWAAHAPDRDWSLATIGRLAAELEVSQMWLLGVSLRAGRVPTDVGRLARAWNVPEPGRLFRLAARMSLDPRAFAGLPDVHAALAADADLEDVISRAARQATDLGTGPRGSTPPAALFELAGRARMTPDEILDAAEITHVSVAELRAASTRTWFAPRSLAVFLEGRLGPGRPPAEVAEGYPTWVLDLRARFTLHEHDIWDVAQQARAAGRTLDWLNEQYDDAPDDAREIFEGWRHRAFPEAESESEPASEPDSETESEAASPPRSEAEAEDEDDEAEDDEAESESDAESEQSVASEPPSIAGLHRSGETVEGLDGLLSAVLHSAAQQDVTLPGGVVDVPSLWSYLATRMAADQNPFDDALRAVTGVGGLVASVVETGALGVFRVLLDPGLAVSPRGPLIDAVDEEPARAFQLLRAYYAEEMPALLGRWIDRIAADGRRGETTEVSSLVRMAVADPDARRHLTEDLVEPVLAVALRINLVTVAEDSDGELEVVRQTHPDWMRAVFVHWAGVRQWQTYRREGPPPALTRAQLTRYLGAAVMPRWLRPLEIDPPRAATAPNLANPAHGAAQLLLNPFLMPLSDLTREFLVRHPNGWWTFAVLRDGQIHLGGEGVAELIPDPELRALYLRMNLADPTLTWQGLLDALGRRGYPSLAPAFAANGQTRAGAARLTGELIRDQYSGRLYLTDRIDQYAATREASRQTVLSWLVNAASLFSTQVGEPVDVRFHGDPDPQPVFRTIEIDTERWTALPGALRLTPDTSGGPPRIERSPASGVRPAVRYRLNATAREWHISVRLHLVAPPGMDLTATMDLARSGVERFLSRPEYVLPGPNVVMRVGVLFGAAQHAHATIDIGAVPANPGQLTWPRLAPPAFYAEQVARFLGVKDRRPPTGALLSPRPRVAPGHDPYDAYALEPHELEQIVGLIAPYFNGSLTTIPDPPADSGSLARAFWDLGVDTPPSSRLTALDWLLGAGVPAARAKRLAANPELGFDQYRTPAFVHRLGLDQDGVRELIDLGEMFGELPGDELTRIAEESGLAGPGPLYAVSRDLGLPPAMLRPLGGLLARVTFGQSGLRPHWGTWTGHLIDALADAGVRTVADVIWLLRIDQQLEVELDLAGEQDEPGRLHAAGLTPEFLAALPPELAEAAIDTYGSRTADEAPPTGSRAERWSWRLGFPVAELGPLLPDPELESLLYPVLRDVPRHELADALAEVADFSRRASAPPADLSPWAYLLRSSPGFVRRVAGWLAVPPWRLMPLAPVFHRLADQPAADRPPADLLAEMIQHYLHVGVFGGPVTVDSALRGGSSLAELADLIDRDLLARSAPAETLREQTPRLAAARAEIERIAAVYRADGRDPALLELLDHVAGRTAGATEAGPDEAGWQLASDLRRAWRSLARPPRQATPGARRRAAEAALQVATAAGALQRMLVAKARLAAGLDADEWQELLDGARSERPELSPAEVEREADRVLADWWAGRLGVPVDELAPALGARGWLDPAGLLKLADALGAEAADLFREARQRRVVPDDLPAYAERWNLSPNARPLLHRLATDLAVPVRALAPIVPLLTDADESALPSIRERIDAAVARLDGVLGDLGDRQLRLEFLADRGLTVHDLGDTWLLARSAERWRANLFAMDVDQARTAPASTLDLVEALRAENERRHPDAGWSTADLARLAAELDTSVASLRGLSVRAGRVPRDTAEWARTLGLNGPSRLFRLGVELGADPGQLPDAATRPEVLEQGPEWVALARAAADARAANWVGPLPSPTAELLNRAAEPSLDWAVPAADADAVLAELLGGASRDGRTVEVDTERWWPLQRAFHIEPGEPGERPQITRPDRGGERVGVRYRLTVAEDAWLFQLRVYLIDQGGDRDDIRDRTTRGVLEYVNQPNYPLTGSDRPIRAEVVFVDDPAEADAPIRAVAPGQLDETGQPIRMDQRTFLSGQDPKAYAHEIVHYFGVRDLRPREGSLLRPVDTTEPDPNDLMNALGGAHPVLGERTVRQIAEVLAPLVAASTTGRPEVAPTPGHAAEEFWSRVDLPPLADQEAAPTPSGLPGFYRGRPHLLYEVDTIVNLKDVASAVAASAGDAIGRRIRSSWRRFIPGLLVSEADTSEIAKALRDDPQSFFVTGGRSFDVRDGTFHWNRVTIAPEWNETDADVVGQKQDKAKYDTRIDHSLGEKSSATVGSVGSLGLGLTLPQRVGVGGAFGLEIALSRPQESVENSFKLTDSHNVRSGTASDLVKTPLRFAVTVTDSRGPLQPPDATRGTATPATVFFRSSGDIAGATELRDATEVAIDPAYKALLVENFTPTRILEAGFDAGETTHWQAVSEQIVTSLAPTKTVNPGTIGAGNLRDLLDERTFLGLLMPALDSVAHPPPIHSRHAAHSLSLRMAAEVPVTTPTAEIAKSSFRIQPGLTMGTTVTHASRVGGGATVVPLRWGFPGGYIQLRGFGGHFRAMIAAASSSSQSRTGTEFKDIPNTLVVLHFSVVLTPALRELPLTRIGSTGVTAPIILELDVQGRLSTAKLRQLMTGKSTVVKAPGADWHVPPYASDGGRSVTLGLTNFAQLRTDVEGLVRRYQGGFLPRFGRPEKIKYLVTARAALERQRNQSELDRVLTPAGLRQTQGSVLKRGLPAELRRRKKIGTRHVVVHVSAEYQNDFEYEGTEKGIAVRTQRADGAQHKVVAGRQIRGGLGVEGGIILRFIRRVSTALTLSGAIEARARVGRRSGVQIGGQEVRLNGGTPDSEVFGNDLRVTVDVYGYTRRFGRDKKARLRLSRVYRSREPRPAAVGTTPRAVTIEQVPGPAGKTMTRFRMFETKPVKVLFDAATVLAAALDAEALFTPRPDPLGVRRNTKVQLDAIRAWVDDDALRPAGVKDWLSVESFPGSEYVLDLARDAIDAAQQYPDRASRTKLDGLRGADSLLAGMPVWAGLLGRLGDEVQAGMVREMLNGYWPVDKLTSGEDGATTDLAVAASLGKPQVLAAFGTITTESATVGSVEVDGVRTVEHQLAARLAAILNVRRTGNVDSVSGGGALFAAGYEQLLFAQSAQTGNIVYSAFERNKNNRKAKARSFLVSFTMRVSVAAEVTTVPHRYRLVPQSLRTGRWLRHYKSVQRDGTVEHAIFLRLSAETVDRLGLLDTLEKDTGKVGAPWRPEGNPQVRLTAGSSLGLGLYQPRDAPDLTKRIVDGLAAAAAELPPEASRLQAVVSAVTPSGLTAEAEAEIEKNRAARILHESISADGLDDAMLNRRRLLYLFSSDGVARHSASMADGGTGVLHLEAGRLTQHARDVRLIAEPVGPPSLAGFLANHDDLDIKTTQAVDESRKVQKEHGHAMLAGAAGSGISNRAHEDLAIGLGDTAGRASYVANVQTTGRMTGGSDLSSGRGIKAVLSTPTLFSLVLFDRGKQVGAPLLSVRDVLTQDRWADDLRLVRPLGSRIPTPARYLIPEPEQLAPGWTLNNGMPLPPRFAAEDLSQVAAIQATVETMLANEARRLSRPGFAGAHQIHESLTSEVLLPGVPQMLTPGGLDLPPVTSAQILGQKATINIRLRPESASLSSVSSGVFREHVRQTGGGYSAGTNQISQGVRLTRLPLIGRGFTADPYQALELGGPGALSGDSHIANDTQNMAGGGLGNVKPESRSAAVDYLTEVVVTIRLPRKPARILAGPRKETSPGTAERTLLRLRMGLHDARQAMHIPDNAAETGGEQSGRVAAFAAIVDQEAKLAKAAEVFTKAADALDQARYEAHAHAAGSEGRRAAEDKLEQLHTSWNDQGKAWWELAQEHYRLVEDFRYAYIGVSTKAGDPELPGRLVQQMGEDALEPRGEEAPPPRPERARPAAPPVTRSPRSANAVRAEVPGGDRSPLYAVIAAEPRLVATSLEAAELGDQQLLDWLRNVAEVRAEVAQLVADRAGPAEVAGTPLGEAAEQLRRLVSRHLRSTGPENYAPDYLDPARVPGDREFDHLLDAVDRWDGLAGEPLGEAFMALLGAVLDARIRIRPDGGETRETGPVDGRAVELFRTGDHYDAGLFSSGKRVRFAPETDEPPPAAVPDAPAAQPARKNAPAGKTEPVDLADPVQAERADRALGRVVWPKTVKPHELDPEYAAEQSEDEAKEVLARGGDIPVRLNPAWMPLSDFTPEVYLSRPGARWHYVVMPDESTYVGSEEPLTALSPNELVDLFVGIRRGNPKMTMRELRESMTMLGHTTIAVRFQKLGRVLVSQARISGELVRDPETGRLVANEKSGRFMSTKVRPELEVDPDRPGDRELKAAQVLEWLGHAAARISAQLGEPVEARPFKHAETGRPQGRDPNDLDERTRAQRWLTALDEYIGILDARLPDIAAEARQAEADAVAAANARRAAPDDQASPDHLTEQQKLADQAVAQAEHWLGATADALDILRAERVTAAEEFARVDAVFRAQPGQVLASLKISDAAREIEGLLVIGRSGDWPARESALPEMAGAAEAAGVSAIVVDGDRLARLAKEGRPAVVELGVLGSALRQYARAGVRPVVFTTGAAEDLTALLDRYQAVSVTAVAAGLGTGWQVAGPDGTATGQPAPLDPGLLVDASSRLGALAVPEVPPSLADWLGAPSWAEAETYLAEHLADLRQPEMDTALSALVAAEPGNRELAAYRVVLDLARHAGPAGAGARFVPPAGDLGIGAAPQDVAPAPGPLSPTFALDYLAHTAGYEQRRPWNDQLVRLLYEGLLTGDQAVALAEGLLVPDGPPPAPGTRVTDHGRANAIVFRAVATVLGLTPQQAAEPDEGGTFQDALELVRWCVVTPTDRWLWILRLAQLRDRIQAGGIPGVAPTAPDHVELLRVLTETLSNC